MNDLDILEKLKVFLQEKVATKIKLELPPQDGQFNGEYKLVNPSVHIGWLPPGTSLNETEHNIPSIIVMSDGGEDGGNEANLNIRLIIGVYDPGLTKTEDDIDVNCKGYKDLLNLITRIRSELSKNLIIEDLIEIEKPIKWRMYDEQMYPYWHAQMEFSINTMPINTMHEFL